MKLLSLILLLDILSCSNKDSDKKISVLQKTEIMSNENFLDSFNRINIEKNFFDIKINKINESPSKLKKAVVIPNDVITNVFLYPVNETEYGDSYIKSKYYAGYKVQIAKNIFILSYIYHFDLHSEKLIWSIYDSEYKKIISNLVVANWNQNVDRSLRSFDGNQIIIVVSYKRHFVNGMEGDNDEPIKISEHYKIDDKFRFVKLLNK